MSDAKAVAKRMKQAGLKRLRWYCQMCEKQCVDENGFKMHCATPGHIAKMKTFAENADEMIDDFSKRFEKSFLDVLHHNHLSNKVFANQVYNELIRDKNHVHMNATMWESLASFVEYLGRTGKCMVEKDDKGFWVRYIDPEARKREMERRDKEEREARAMQRREADIKRQAEEARAAAAASLREQREEEYDDMPEPSGPVRVSLARSSASGHAAAASVFGKAPVPVAVKAEPTGHEAAPEMGASTSTKTTTQERHTWVQPPGLVVRIANPVDPAMRDAKGVVVDERDGKVELLLLKSGDSVADMPVSALETVVPGPDGEVVVLTGPRLNERAKVQFADPLKLEVEVAFTNGAVERLGFDDVCKPFE